MGVAGKLAVEHALHGIEEELLPFGASMPVVGGRRLDLGDDVDDVLSEIVDLEENFGEEASGTEADDKPANKHEEQDDKGDISELDNDALLNENKK